MRLEKCLECLDFCSSVLKFVFERLECCLEHLDIAMGVLKESLDTAS